MKKALVFFLFVFIAGFVFAETDDEPYEQETISNDKRAAISFGPEWNMNSHENFAMGGTLAFDFNVSPSFAFGYNVTVSSNLTDLLVIEPATFLRWYFSTSWFLQADAGAYLLLDNDLNEVTPMFLGGLRTGVRLPLGDTLFVEPFGRVGYPFAFGVGVMMGFRFPKQAVEENNNDTGAPVINR